MPMIGIVDSIDWTLVTGARPNFENGGEHSLEEIREEVNREIGAAQGSYREQTVKSLQRFLSRTEKHFDELGYGPEDVVTVLVLH